MNCYVLTGGLSRRMGTPKRSLVLGERTFLERIASAAAPVFDRVFEVTREGEPGGGVVETIFEPAHERTSPLFGILASLEHAGAAAWIVATDYPLIGTTALRFLRDRFAATSVDLLVPMWNGEPQTLCAGFRPAVTPSIRRNIQSGIYRVHDLLSAAEVEYVDESTLRALFPGEPFANVNDPQEYERIRRAYA